MPYKDSERQKQYYHYYYVLNKTKKRENRKRSYYKHHEKELEQKRIAWAKRSTKIATQRRVKRREQKQSIINKYGGKCICCGEKYIEFLTMDHINGDGAQHRKKIGRGNLYKWIITHNYPNTFRVLCYNCNCSIGHYGYCPHSWIERRY